MRRPATLLIAFVLVLAANAAGAESYATLLEGSRAFRDGRYPEALVAFRVAERQASSGREAVWYTAATLYKLGRVDEALAAFDKAGREAPELRDTVLDFYFASAAFEARLYLTADERLATLAPQAGPKLRSEVQRLRDRIARLFDTAPDTKAIDWYLARAGAERAAGHAALSRAFFAEAAALSRKRGPPHHRLDEALDGLGPRTGGAK